MIPAACDIVADRDRCIDVLSNHLDGSVITLLKVARVINALRAAAAFLRELPETGCETCGPKGPCRFPTFCSLVDASYGKAAGGAR
jgi:hypothetical protein